MAVKVKVRSLPNARGVTPAFASSGERGRPVADLVRKLEKINPKLMRGKGLSSAAFEAADLVRNMRKAAGLSQVELARNIGVSQSRISEIEAGSGTQGPTWDVMSRIAHACGMYLVPRISERKLEVYEEQASSEMILYR